MTEAGATIVAAFGGALLGAGLTWLAGWLQSIHLEKAANREERKLAYLALLDAAWMYALKAQALGLTKRERSGPAESFAVLLGWRRPVDPMELHDWLAADFAPLMKAFTRVQAAGSPSAIRMANQLMSACNAVMLHDLAEKPASRQQKGISRRGSEPTPGLWEARVSFLNLVRAEMREEFVAFDILAAEGTSTNARPDTSATR